jgi:hypothetical protein
LLIGEGSEIGSRSPSLETHQVRETVLLVERLVRYFWTRARLPLKVVGVDDHVAPFPPRELSQLHEQDAAGFREGGMAEALRIEEVCARRPVPVFVGEHAFEHQDLLPVRMIVRRKSRSRLVAHDGRDLA